MLAGALILLLKTLKIFAGGTEDAEDTDIVALGSTGSDSVAEHSDLWTSAELEAGLQGLLDSPQPPHPHPEGEPWFVLKRSLPDF